MIHRLALIGEPPQVRWAVAFEGYPPEIDPTARIEAYATVDAGEREPTRIGAHAWVMKLVHVGHDAQVGESCELAPFTTVGGYSRLGKRVRCGINVTILPYVMVGDGARLGAGAVVTKNVPAGEVWAGNPARAMPPRDPDAPLKCGCYPAAGVFSRGCRFHAQGTGQNDERDIVAGFEGGEDGWLR